MSGTVSAAAELGRSANVATLAPAAARKCRRLNSPRKSKPLQQEHDSDWRFIFSSLMVSIVSLLRTRTLAARWGCGTKQSGKLAPSHWPPEAKDTASYLVRFARIHKISVKRSAMYARAISEQADMQPWPTMECRVKSISLTFSRRRARR